MPLRRCHRRWIALIALFGLLFQQLAMASYLCPLEQTPARPHHASTKQPPCHAPATPPADDAVRCAQHCSPVTPSADHAPSPTVPALLPATTWQPALVLACFAPRGHVASEIRARATSPPLTIRDCTFQI